jgi:rhodanese-related sulfurtransferase
MSMSATEKPTEIELDPERVAGWLSEDPAPQVIDVREPHEREAGHIEGTRHIALVELSSQASTVERDQPVVFYCRVGQRSDMAAQAFRAAGYEAYSMRGGLQRWAREGRPLTPADGYVADNREEQ